MNFNNVLMWIFTIIILFGIIICFVQSYKSDLPEGLKPYLVNKYEGPILVTVGLVASVIVGLMSGNKVKEGFKSAYGL